MSLCHARFVVILLPDRFNNLRVTHIDVIRYEEKAGGMEALHER